MNRVARVAVFSACVLWAISFVATKEALLAVPPLTVVTIRLLMAALCFAAWLVWRSRSARDSRVTVSTISVRAWATLAALSTVGTGLHYGSQTIGLQYTSASNASLWAITAPITIVILAAVFLGERVSAMKIVGICVAVTGVLTVLGWGTLLALELTAHMIGDLLVMASIVMWGIFTVFGKKITDGLGAMTVTAMVTIIGAMWMLPVGWLEARNAQVAWQEIPYQAWLAIAFLGIGCTFLATLLYFIALQRSESQKVGAYLYTIPPMTAVVARLYLGEELALSFFVGSALVFIGVYVTDRA